MNNKRTPIIIGAVLAAILIALFAWPKINNPNGGLIAQFNKAGIGCMSSHSRVSQHFHPHLSIIVDGANEAIPHNVGLFSNCMAEIHTHDQSGLIHVETIVTDHNMYLKDFFTVWGKSIEREGYDLAMTVDGKENPFLGDLLLVDAQKIVLSYSKK